jgi:uncharacterized protein (DUF2249 family)
MSESLDLGELPRDAHRSRVFDALDERDSDETMTVVADHDLALELTLYGIKRGHDIDWVREETDDGTFEIEVTKGDALPSDALCEFDVREMPPQRRHSVLLDAFDDLEPHEGFVLVNDHDPKPLYHELRSTRGDNVEWEYRNEGSGEWRVAIGKTGPTTAPDSDVITAFDVRDIPKAERHETIHHRYGMIPVGESMEIVAPHEPRPLRGEFQQRYGDAFSWEIQEQEPGRCRVHITKDGPAAAAADAPAVDTGGHSCGHHHAASEEPASVGSGTHADESADDAASDGETGLSVTAELDVRDRPPAERHAAIFRAYDDLGAGEAFVLVNDHDPKPLYHQFDAEAGDEFVWVYRRRSPGEFRVLIGKDETARSDAVDGDGTVDAPF